MEMNTQELKDRQVFEVGQLVGQTVIFPVLPGSVMAAGAGVALTAISACVSLLLLSLIGRPRALLGGTSWYRWVVAYSFVSSIACGAARVFRPEMTKIAATCWVVGLVVVTATLWDKWLDATKRY